MNRINKSRSGTGRLKVIQTIQQIAKGRDLQCMISRRTVNGPPISLKKMNPETPKRPKQKVSKKKGAPAKTAFSKPSETELHPLEKLAMSPGPMMGDYEQDPATMPLPLLRLGMD